MDVRASVAVGLAQGPERVTVDRIGFPDSVVQIRPDIHGGYEWTVAGHEFALRVHSKGFT